MKKQSFSGIVAILLLTACSTVPLTGRKQLSLVNSGELSQLANSQYDDFLKKNKVITGTADARRVKDIGHNLADAVTRYMTQNGYGQTLKELKLDWEFNLVESKDVNAWCMPGGKVAVYTGIIPVTKDDAGLATVMGHEIAHAIAKHSGERMSHALAAQGIQVAANVALSNKDPKTVNIFNGLYGIGSNVGLLAYSRKQESEADHLGLIFMAMAGYDPAEAANFWQRMSASSKGNKPPEFLSTHPSDERRIRDIRELLPEARKYYKK